MPDVSLLATLVATLLGFALGGLWYGPVFGARWMAAVGLAPGELQRQRRPVAAYAITFVLGLVSAFAVGLYLGPNPGLAFSVTVGAVAGVGLVAPALTTNYIFEGRRPVLMVINGGYHVVRLTLAGAVFGLIG